MATINPYLNFSGNCEEAFEFYQSVFGGELDLQRFSEVPEGVPNPDEGGDGVMHVTLPIGEDQVLMGSDRPASMGPTTFGDSASVSVSPDSSEDGKRIFEELSSGGEVNMPYERAFWGDDFGMLTDRFGINWMVNYSPPQG